MDLTTVDQLRRRFLRLVGANPEDHALTAFGEDDNAVVDEYLTQGIRSAQRWMLDNGYVGWRKRSSTLSFTMESDGRRYAALPADFLRAYGDVNRSPLVDAEGNRWGVLIRAEQDDRKGDLLWFEDGTLWLARDANPPTLYLDYHGRHEAITDDATIDFPLEARPLVPAEAANAAKEESWFPRDGQALQGIERALLRAQLAAKAVCRQTKDPRRWREPPRYADNW